MTLSAFQQALCDLTASPQNCILARENPEIILANYDLTSRERERLINIIHQPGMSTNCTLYRVNRITPIYTLLPNTSFLLGDDLVKWADQFWRTEVSDLQFKSEVERFGDFIRQQIQSGIIQNEFLEEILEFELAINSLRFVPKKRILHEINQAEIDTSSTKIRLHPLIRIIKFQHEPTILLSHLALAQLPPVDIAQGEYYLLLDVTHHDLDVKRITPELGKILQNLETNEVKEVAHSEFEALISSSFAVRLEQTPSG